MGSPSRTSARRDREVLGLTHLVDEPLRERPRPRSGPEPFVSYDLDLDDLGRMVY